MGDDGTKTLGVGGGNGTTVTLNFGTVTNNQNYALQGNLFLGSWGNGKVNGTFGGKGISGNITLKGGTNNILTFNNGAGIGGNIIISGGTTTFKPNDSQSLVLTTQMLSNGWNTGGTLNFEGASVTINKKDNNSKIINTINSANSIFNFKAVVAEINGDIYAVSNNLVNTVTSNTLGFTSATSATINGNIESTASSSGVSSSRNTITFSGAGINTINGTITATSLLSKDQKENNVINFTSSTGTNIIIGVIQSKEDGYGWNAKNKITLWSE